MQKSKSFSRAFYVALIVVLAVFALVWTQKQAIYDYLRLRGYTPPTEIVQLATNTTMNDSARRLFYVHHPELNDKSLFRTNCGGFDEQTNVLGCYVRFKGIYIFDVTDPRLHGVEEVTAAHEMLHAAYDRLGTKDREKVDNLTKQVYESSTDQRLKETVESYRSRDPSVVPNELHSIIGTEVGDLPQDLEDYYKRYFDDRSKIVANYHQYEDVFTELKDRADTILRELEGLEQEAKQLGATLETEAQYLRSERPNVDTQAEVTAYNARVNGYNADVREYNALVNRYKALVEEHNSIALEHRQLNQALNTLPTL